MGRVELASSAALTAARSYADALRERYGEDLAAVREVAPPGAAAGDGHRA